MIEKLFERGNLWGDLGPVLQAAITLKRNGKKRHRFPERQLDKAGASVENTYLPPENCSQLKKESLDCSLGCLTTNLASV
jgi:hypothetical protein